MSHPENDRMTDYCNDCEIKNCEECPYRQER